MGLLDAEIGQIVTTETSFGVQSATLRSTITQAEQTAVSSQAFHQGESALAFQAAHARFAEAAAKINLLLDTAQLNLGEGATTYVAQDGEGATDITATVGALPTQIV